MIVAIGLEEDPFFGHPIYIRQQFIYGRLEIISVILFFSFPLSFFGNISREAALKFIRA